MLGVKDGKTVLKWHYKLLSRSISSRQTYSFSPTAPIRLAGKLRSALRNKQQVSFPFTRIGFAKIRTSRVRLCWNYCAYLS